MRYTWIDEYLLSKAGVTKDLQKDWNWIRYQIGGKMFVAVCLGENDEPYYITLKLEPAEGDFLRQQYEDIIPGYYMNKTHWNSIKPDGEVPDNFLKDLLGQFTRNYTQTVKRAADNKRRYAPGWVHSTCLLRGFPKGAAPHLAHDFAEQSVVCYTLCRRCPENTVAAGEGKGI